MNPMMPGQHFENDGTPVFPTKYRVAAYVGLGGGTVVRTDETNSLTIALAWFEVMDAMSRATKSSGTWMEGYYADPGNEVRPAGTVRTWHEMDFADDPRPDPNWEPRVNTENRIVRFVEDPDETAKQSTLEVIVGRDSNGGVLEVRIDTAELDNDETYIKVEVDGNYLLVDRGDASKGNSARLIPIIA